MTPKEKAEELLGKFYQPIDPLHNYPMCYHTAKQCALIAVDEILKVRPTSTEVFGGLIDLSGCIDASKRYWQEVKQEIEKL